MFTLPPTFSASLARRRCYRLVLASSALPRSARGETVLFGEQYHGEAAACEHHSTLGDYLNRFPSFSTIAPLTAPFSTINSFAGADSQSGTAQSGHPPPPAVPLWLSAPAKELIVKRTERLGVRSSEKDGKSNWVNAKRAVVLACGGFPHDIARRKELFPHAPTGQEHYSPGPTGNTGDGLRLARRSGAR